MASSFKFAPLATSSSSSAGAKSAARSGVDRLYAMLERGNVVVLTGAGISTDSGIPDYRSPTGSYSVGHKPMLHSEFVSSEANRKRYWLRSMFGYGAFQASQPNDGHRAISELQRRGIVDSVITQNVDRLHQKAGSESVLEIHGHLSSVGCLSCGANHDRAEYQDLLRTQNAEWVKHHLQLSIDDLDFADIRADGDANIAHDDLTDFSVPACSVCKQGVLKPNVVFFGGSLDPSIREAALKRVTEPNVNSLLVVGSSLSTWSALRLARAAKDQGKDLGILNIGPTRADDIADFLCPENITKALQDAILPLCSSRA